MKPVVMRKVKIVGKDQYMLDAEYLDDSVVRSFSLSRKYRVFNSECKEVTACINVGEVYDIEVTNGVVTNLRQCEDNKVFNPDECEKVMNLCLNTFLLKPKWKYAFKGATHIIRKNNMIEEQRTFHFARKNELEEFYSENNIPFHDFEVVGENVVFAGQSDKADRFNNGKPQLSMVLEAGLALSGCAKVLEFGAKKYDRSNWKKGLEINSIMDSMTRHQIALMSGETIDPESGLPHVDHIMCNALFMSEMYHSEVNGNE